MLFKPKHKLQDIQYEAIGMRGGAYSYVPNIKKEKVTEDNDSIVTIELMNNEILESAYKNSKSNAKASSIVKAFSLPIFFFMAFLYFGYQFVNIDNVSACFLFAILFSFSGAFTVQQLTYISERMKVNYISFALNLFKKFDIRLFNFTKERKAQSCIGIIALWSVIINSKFYKKSSTLQQSSIQETIKAGVDANHFYDQLSMLYDSLKIVVQKCYNEEMQNIKNQKKLAREAKEAKEKMAQEEKFKQVSSDIDERIKNAYFNQEKNNLRNK